MEVAARLTASSYMSMSLRSVWVIDWPYLGGDCNGVCIGSMSTSPLLPFQSTVRFMTDPGRLVQVATPTRTYAVHHEFFDVNCDCIAIQHPANLAPERDGLALPKAPLRILSPLLPSTSVNNEGKQLLSYRKPTRVQWCKIQVIFRVVAGARISMVQHRELGRRCGSLLAHDVNAVLKALESAEHSIGSDSRFKTMSKIICG